MSGDGIRPASRRPTVALLPWGNVIEDLLETAGIWLEESLGDFVRSWMFGYVEALLSRDTHTSATSTSTRLCGCFSPPPTSRSFRPEQRASPWP
jgi:hypothetical protein